MKAINKIGKITARLLWILFLVWAAILMIELTLPYITFEKNVDFLLTKLNVYHIRYWRFGFYNHIFFSILTLTAGFTQFSPYILRNSPKIHRFAGYVYVVVLLFISGPGAWVMAFHANGGLPARTSFVLLTFLWYIFTLTSVYYIRKKNWNEHGNFMLRSYALTFSAVTLRFYAYIIDYIHLDIKPVEAYITLAWISWVPNMLIAELMIRLGFIKYIFKAKKNV